MGDAVNLAARLMGKCERNQTRCDLTTAQAVMAHGWTLDEQAAFMPKGKDETVRSFAPKWKRRRKSIPDLTSGLAATAELPGGSMAAAAAAAAAGQQNASAKGGSAGDLLEMIHVRPSLVGHDAATRAVADLLSARHLCISNSSEGATALKTLRIEGRRGIGKTTVVEHAVNMLKSEMVVVFVAPNAEGWRVTTNDGPQATSLMDAKSVPGSHAGQSATDAAGRSGIHHDAFASKTTHFSAHISHISHASMTAFGPSGAVADLHRNTHAQPGVASAWRALVSGLPIALLRFLNRFSDHAGATVTLEGDSLGYSARAALQAASKDRDALAARWLEVCELGFCSFDDALVLFKFVRHGCSVRRMMGGYSSSGFERPPTHLYTSKTASSMRHENGMFSDDINLNRTRDDGTEGLGKRSLLRRRPSDAAAMIGQATMFDMADKHLRSSAQSGSRESRESYDSDDGRLAHEVFDRPTDRIPSFDSEGGRSPGRGMLLRQQSSMPRLPAQPDEEVSLFSSARSAAQGASRAMANVVKSVELSPGMALRSVASRTDRMSDSELDKSRDGGRTPGLEERRTFDTSGLRNTYNSDVDARNSLEDLWSHGDRLTHTDEFGFENKPGWVRLLVTSPGKEAYMTCELLSYR